MKTQVQPANDYQWMVKPGLISLGIVIVLTLVIFGAWKALSPPHDTVDTATIHAHQALKKASGKMSGI